MARRPVLEPHVGAAGSFVSVPRDVLHTFRNPGPGEARFLNLHAPGSASSVICAATSPSSTSTTSRRAAGSRRTA